MEAVQEPQEEKGRGKSQAARGAATRRLVEAHKEEFDTILNEERKNRGLFPIGQNVPTKAVLQKENDRLRELMAKHGIDPDAA